MNVDVFIAQCKYANQSVKKWQKILKKSTFIGIIVFVVIWITGLFTSVPVLFFLLAFVAQKLVVGLIMSSKATKAYAKDVRDRAEWIALWLKEALSSQAQILPFDTTGFLRAKNGLETLSVNFTGVTELSVGEVVYDGVGQKLVFTNYDGLKAWLNGLPGLQTK